MSKQIREYSCLLISPSDVQRERDALTDLVINWNAQIGRALGARVDLVKWESHAVPDMSAEPQEVIDKQLVVDSDFGIAVFWSRIGTPTRKHASGSVEEIYKLAQRGARVLVYLNTSAIPQEALKDDQYRRLQDAKKRFEKDGLIATYSDISQLREKVQLHITSVVSELLARDSKDPIPEQTVATASVPDVRVKVSPAVTADPWGRGIDLLVVTVQNYSPGPVFLGNVFLEASNNMTFFAAIDPITRERQTKRKLESGESFDFHFTKEQLSREASPYELQCAAVRDAVDRVYRSSKQEFQKVLQAVFR
jgi:hypothetical protein